MKITILVVLLVGLLAGMYYMQIDNVKKQTIVDVSEIHKNILNKKTFTKITSSSKTIYKTNGEVSISWTRSN